MAETTTSRFALRRWSAGTDTPQRTEFDTNFANIETLAAIDKQGTFAARPAAGVQGTYYWDTTNSFLWRDTGSAWALPSARGQDAIFKSSTNSAVPLTVDAPSGQSTNLFELKVNGSTLYSVTQNGNVNAGNFTGKTGTFVNATTGSVALSVTGASGQTANLFELKNNSNAVQMSVSNTGVVQSSFLRSGTTSTVNAASSTNVANMAYWSGTPSFEVRSNVASGAFNEFVYFKRDAVAATAVDRRFGIVMKVGAEDAPGAGRSAALYLYSGVANMDTPQFNIDVRDQQVWSMSSTTGSVTGYPVHASGSYLRSTPSGTGALQMGNTWIGLHNSQNTMYFRSGTNTNGFYWYGGGVHSEASGDPGVGGQMYMVLSPTVAGSGKLTLGRLQVTEITDADPANIAPAFQIGLTNAKNMIFDSDEIMALDNGSANNAQLALQYDGGILALGGDTTKVRVNNHVLWLSTDGGAPPSPVFGDVWIDIRFGEGLKYRNGSNQWIKLG